MALNPISAALRPLHYNSNQPGKVQVVIAPGETLHVSDALADQLQRADTHFEDIAPPDSKAKATAEPAEPAEVDEPVKAKRAQKSKD